VRLNAFKIDPKAVKEDKQIGRPFVRVGGPCSCGCTPAPFVAFSNGEVGLWVEFESEAEIAQFREAIEKLKVTKPDGGGEGIDTLCTLL
jgi:hypothetical protein